MAHLHRFYLPAELAAGTQLDLEGDEAHHALHAVRLRAGDVVALINGRGTEARARVETCTRHTVRLALERCDTLPPGQSGLTLIQASLHNPKATEFLLRHGTETGVARFIFFRGQHSERPRLAPEKMERIAIQALKQCGRRWLPEIECVEDLDAALATATGKKLIASMDRSPVPLASAVDAGNLSLFVGPEGDFSAAETERILAAGAQPVSLGHYTYRSEVAAVLLSALIQQARGELGPI